MMTLRRRAAQGVRVMSAMSAVVLFGALHTGCGAEDLEADQQPKQWVNGWKDVYFGAPHGPKRLWVERSGDLLIADGDIIVSGAMVREPGQDLRAVSSPLRTQGVTGEDLLDGGYLGTGKGTRWPVVGDTITVDYCVDASIMGVAPNTAKNPRNGFITLTEIEAATKAWEDAMAAYGASKRVKFNLRNPNSHPSGAGAASHGVPSPCPADPDDVLTIKMVADNFHTCSASLGRTGDPEFKCDSALSSKPTAQRIEWRGPALIHELGHALGLLHEQSRADRDFFVLLDAVGTDSTPPKTNDIDFGTQDFWGPLGESIDLGSFNTQSVMLYDSSWGRGGYSSASDSYSFDYRMRNGLEVPDNNVISLGDVNAVEQLYAGEDEFDSDGGVRVSQGVGAQMPFCTSAPPPTSGTPWPPRATCTAPTPYPPLQFSPPSKVFVDAPGDNEWGTVADLSAHGLGMYILLLRENGDIQASKYSDGGFAPPQRLTTALHATLGGAPGEPIIVPPTPASAVGFDLVVPRRDADGIIRRVVVVPLRFTAPAGFSVEPLVTVESAIGGIAHHVFAGDLNGDKLPDLGFVELDRAGDSRPGFIGVALNTGSSAAEFLFGTVWATTSISVDDGTVARFAVADGRLVASRTSPLGPGAEFVGWEIEHFGYDDVRFREPATAVPLLLDGQGARGLSASSIVDATGDGALDIVVRGDFGIWVAPGRGAAGVLPFKLDLVQNGDRWASPDAVEELCPDEPCHWGFGWIPGTTPGADLVAFTPRRD